MCPAGDGDEAVPDAISGRHCEGTRQAECCSGSCIERAKKPSKVDKHDKQRVVAEKVVYQETSSGRK